MLFSYFIIIKYNFASIRSVQFDTIFYSKFGDTGIPCEISTQYPSNSGHAVARLVEALHYKPEGRGFDSQWRNWIFSLT